MKQTIRDEFLNHPSSVIRYWNALFFFQSEDGSLPGPTSVAAESASDTLLNAEFGIDRLETVLEKKFHLEVNTSTQFGTFADLIHQITEFSKFKTAGRKIAIIDNADLLNYDIQLSLRSNTGKDVNAVQFLFISYEQTDCIRSLQS